MSGHTTEDVIIGIVAAVGVLVLIVVFIYVVRRIIMRND